MRQEPRLATASFNEISILEGHSSWRLPSFAGAVGAAAVLLSLALAPGHLRQFWHSQLVAGLFFLSLALGGLFFVLLQFVCRAGWSVVIRRPAEHLMGTLPLLAVLFSLLAFGFHDLYPWSRSEVVAHDPQLAHKTPYLNPFFFYVRSLFYLLSWSVLAWWFRRQSLRQDEDGDPGTTRRLQTASAPALVLFGVTVSFAAFDWILSLEPHWYSTIFGIYFFSGCVVGALALLVVLVSYLQWTGPLRSVVSSEHLHDLGKLLFGFMVFWAYIAFSQFLLIWYGNIPEETVWYAQRLGDGWMGTTWALALGHFVLPFFFLLPRDVKRRRSTLLIASTWLLAMHYLDLYWLVMPSLHRNGFHPHLLDAVSFVAFGGLFVGSLGLSMRRTPSVPIRDPRLLESLAFENT